MSNAVENAAIVITWVEAYNLQDFDRLLGWVTKEFRTNDPVTGHEISGREAFRSMASRVAREFPDRRIEIAQLLPLGASAVAVRAVWDGTAAFDLPSGVVAGQHVQVTKDLIAEIFDGRIASMAELSLIPT